MRVGGWWWCVDAIQRITVGYFVKLVQSDNPRRIDEVVRCLAAGLWTVFPRYLIVWCYMEKLANIFILVADCDKRTQSPHICSCFVTTDDRRSDLKINKIKPLMIKHLKETYLQCLVMINFAQLLIALF